MEHHVKLTLWCDFSETSTTGVALYDYDTQSIVRTFAYALESCQQTWLLMPIIALILSIPYFFSADVSKTSLTIAG